MPDIWGSLRHQKAMFLVFFKQQMWMEINSKLLTYFCPNGGSLLQEVVVPVFEARWGSEGSKKGDSAAQAKMLDVKFHIFTCEMNISKPYSLFFTCQLKLQPFHMRICFFLPCENRLYKLFYSRASDNMAPGFKYKMIRRRVKTLRNVSVWIFCRAATHNISLSFGTHPDLSSAVCQNIFSFKSQRIFFSFAHLLVVVPVYISAVKPKPLQRRQRKQFLFKKLGT